MSADLRERVARAIAKEEHGSAETWEFFTAEADAVLAELAPELQPRQPHLQSVLDAAIERALIDGTVAVKVIPSAELGLTQAEPVAYVVDWPNDFCDKSISPTVPWSQLPVGTKLYASPAPRVSAEDVALVDGVIHRHVEWHAPIGVAQAWQRIRASLGVGQ